MTETKKIPPSLILFLKDNFRNGSLLLPKHVDDFERNRVELDENGVLFNVGKEVNGFLRLYFLFGKILTDVLTNKKSLGAKIPSLPRKNMKVSVLII